MSKTVRMLDCIAQQRRGESRDFLLSNFSDAHLAHVERFIRSFTPALAGGPALPSIKTSNEVAELRADRVKLQGEIERLTHELAEARATRPFPPDLVRRVDELPRDFEDRARAATDIEALAQRLAKVENGWAVANRDVGKLHARIDQACEIIGAHIGGLEERLDRAGRWQDAVTKALDGSSAINAGWWRERPNEARPYFPTGAATTAEEAIAQVEEPGAESEPLQPQRGDRVRLEGARSAMGTLLVDGWFDVNGSGELDFQVAGSTLSGSALFWVRCDDPGLKEVRRGAANLPA